MAARRCLFQGDTCLAEYPSNFSGHCHIQQMLPPDASDLVSLGAALRQIDALESCQGSFDLTYVQA